MTSKQRLVWMVLTFVPLAIPPPLFAGALPVSDVQHAGPVDFQSEVLPFLKSSCLACHNKTKAKAKLVLESPADILKGGTSGPAVVPGHAQESLLLQAASHRNDDLVMPPKDNKVAAPDLTPRQLGLLKLWIEQGATGEVHDSFALSWQPLPKGLDAIYAVAVTGDGQLAACSRANGVYIYNLITRRLVTNLTDPQLLQESASGRPGIAHRDVVHALAFSPDGNLLASGGYGEVKLWRRPRSVRRFSFDLADKGEVRALAASPDRSRIAAGSTKGRIRIWDDAGKTLAEFSPHAAEVTAVRFSPDGSNTFLAYVDGSLLVCDWRDGTVLASATAPAAVRALAWTTDGKVLASAGDDKLIHLWALPNGADNQLLPQGELGGHSDAVTALDVISADANRLCSGGADGAVRVWDVRDRKQVWQAAHGGPVSGLAASPDGRRIVSVGANHLARLWDADGKLIAEMKGDALAQERAAEEERLVNVSSAEVAFRRSSVQTAQRQHASQLDRVRKALDAFSAAEKGLADKRQALTAANAAKGAAEKALADAAAELKRATDARDAADKTAADALAAAKSAPAEGREAVIEDATAKAFAAGLARAHYDQVAGQIHERQKEIGEKLAAVNKVVSEIGPELTKLEAAKATADDELRTAIRIAQQAADTLAAAQVALQAADAKYQVRQAKDADAKKASAESEKPLRAAAFSADGLVVAVGGDDRVVHTYAAETGAPLDEFRGPEGPVAAIAAAGKLIWASANDSVIAWDTTAPWTLERTLGSGDASSALADRVNALAFSPDGQQLAAGGGVPSRGGQITLWHVPTGKLLKSRDDVHSDTVLVLEFSPDGALLASGSADRLVNLINVETGAVVKSLEGHAGHVLGVAWRPDGRQLASAGADGVVKLWDIASGEKKNVEGFTKEVTSVHYLADGGQLLATCGDGSARIFADSGSTIRTLPPSLDFLDCSAVTPDGRFTLVGGEDGTLRLFSPTTAQLSASFAP